jgi:Holliday junction resolvase-like predicted endonuclease
LSRRWDDLTMDVHATDRRRTAAQQAGDAAEGLVERRLTEMGWTVLARNLHVGRHELDIVAADPGPPAALVVVEVRWRRSRDFGLPEETFDHRKRQRLRAAVGRLLEDGLPGGSLVPALPLRIDLFVVEPGPTPGAASRIRHHRDALAG